jgi:hypothetical protein
MRTRASSWLAPHTHMLVVLNRLMFVVVLDHLTVLILGVVLVLAVLYVSNSVCMSVCVCVCDVCVHIIFLT